MSLKKNEFLKKGAQTGAVYNVSGETQFPISSYEEWTHRRVIFSKNVG